MKGNLEGGKSDHWASQLASCVAEDYLRPFSFVSEPLKLFLSHSLPLCFNKMFSLKSQNSHPLLLTYYSRCNEKWDCDRMRYCVPYSHISRLDHTFFLLQLSSSADSPAVSTEWSEWKEWGRLCFWTPLIRTGPEHSLWNSLPADLIPTLCQFNKSADLVNCEDSDLLITQCKCNVVCV